MILTLKLNPTQVENLVKLAIIEGWKADEMFFHPLESQQKSAISFLLMKLSSADEIGRPQVVIPPGIKNLT